jgi:hypothetical protein
VKNRDKLTTSPSSECRAIPAFFVGNIQAIAEEANSGCYVVGTKAMMDCSVRDAFVPMMV